MVSLSVPLSPSVSEQLLSGAGAAAPEGAGAAAQREWCERPCRADWVAVEGIVLIDVLGGWLINPWFTPLPRQNPVRRLRVRPPWQV